VTKADNGLMYMVCNRD